MMSPLALGFAAALCFAAVAAAHGGQYRGPPDPGAPPAPGGGGRTGFPAGPTTPGPGSPTTGAGAATSDEVSWQVWWEFNKDEFLQEGLGALVVPTTGSDDFYLGTRRVEARVDTLATTDADLSERIVPALAALLDRERNRDVQSACLLALGKIGRDGKGVDLVQVLAARINRDDQEVRESAVLALGIASMPKALPLLTSLVRDESQGRRLAQRDEVGDRTRAFAAYGLGLLARASDDVAVKQRVHDTLWAVLRDKEIDDRDLRAALVNGLGILCADPDRSAHKRLAWLTVEELLAWYQLDLGRGNEAVQAHAPVAIGRLLGRGSNNLQQRCKTHFVGVLNATSRRSNAILQSAALALGMIGLPAETSEEDGATSRALQQHFLRGNDRLARYLSVIGLGRIGGSANRKWLMENYQRANKNTERPWLALALGLLSTAAAGRGEIDESWAHMLIDDLPDASKPEARSAFAVALGLTGYDAGAPLLQRQLRENEQDEVLAGYLCVSLALLGDRASAPTITEVLQRSQRRPFLLLQAAHALGRLGDREATDRLLEMLDRGESTAVLAAIANAIGQIGDRRAIDPLIARTQDDQLTKLARAFVAAALGGVGDRRPLPWNQPLSRDSNYSAPVDTLTNGSTGVLDIL